MNTVESTAPKGAPPKRRRSGNSDDIVKRAKPETSNEFEDLMKKTMLSNGQKIGAFVGHKTNIEVLVAVFSRETSLLGNPTYNEELHRYSTSILANCCFTDRTPHTGMQIKKAQRVFLDLAVRICESSTTNMDIRVSMCRLIGNLCQNKELVTSWLSRNTILFDRIALLLESSIENIVTQCLRIFLYLANHSFTRVSLFSLIYIYLLTKMRNVKTGC
ncbi:unnamed protein product [Caenorhabditis sp. 36 PRJEB53466]|nr:unnamed protein product [Caenorhabditis sp. 36 PRJEB53466]